MNADSTCEAMIDSRLRKQMNDVNGFRLKTPTTTATTRSLEINFLVFTSRRINSRDADKRSASCEKKEE